MLLHSRLVTVFADRVTQHRKDAEPTAAYAGSAAFA